VDPGRTTTYSDSGWVNGGWTSFSIPGSVDQTSTGTYEATAPAFERLEYGDLDPALTNSNNFPDYDLGATNDHLEGKAARLYEQITSGGNFTATITLGDATATAGPVSTTGKTFEMALALYYCLCVATAQAFQDSATGLIEANFAGVPLGAAVDHTTAAGTGDAAAGALATSTSSSAIETYTTTEAALWPGNGIEIPATLRGPSGAYPDSLTMEYVSHRNTLGNEATSTISLGPSATATRTQARYDVEIDVNTSGVSEAIDEYAPTRAWLTPASLGAAGENSSDWRLQFRGKQWTIGELAETNPWNLFDGSSAAGWHGTNASISSSGGVISVAASGGEGSASHNFSPHGKIEAWRYLRLRVRGSAAMSLILELDNDIKPKKWRFDVTTSFADVDIDLCNPKAVEGVKRVNEKYSRWPLDSSRVDDDGTWGVSQLKELIISAIPDGETLEIDYIRLVRDGDLEWSLLPAFNWWINTTGSQQGSPFAVLNADGRISDWPGVRRTGGSYSWPTITQLMGDIGGLVGLSFTAAGSFPDSFHTNAREALLIYGSGATYDTGYDWGQDKEPIGNITAQMLWDQIEAFPECGDVWGWDTGAYGGPLVMPTAKILRGQAWGLVLDQDGPVASETVTYRTSPGAADRGSDISEADGYYLTGTPWGLSTGLHRVHAISRQSEELANRNRWRRRVVFRDIEAVRPLALANTRAPWPQYLEIAEDGVSGDLGAFREQFERPLGSLSALSELLSATETWGADLELARGGGQAWAAYSRAGDIYAKASDDDGQTWSTETLILSDALFPQIVFGAPEAVFGMRPDTADDPGILVGVAREPGTSSWGSVFTLTASGSPIRVEPTPFAIVSEESGRTMVLAARKEGETAITRWWSADGGRTWTES
jgi:hypothetical protein